MNKTIQGKLIALGGGDDDGLLRLIRSQICEVTAHIEVIATAATTPEESGQAYKEAFEELGFKNVRFMHIDEDNPADQKAYINRIRKADVIFFTGGDQVRLYDFLAGTMLAEIMKERYRNENIMIAGTSAGAAVMSDCMIYDGYGHYSLIKGEMKTTKGLAFIHGVYIDTHFTERGRFGRLAHALALQQDYIGIGLGEETGIIISEGNQVEVFGTGVVTIMDASDVKYTNSREVQEGDNIAFEHMIMHLLVEGHVYCLKERLFRKSSQRSVAAAQQAR